MHTQFPIPHTRFSIAKHEGVNPTILKWDRGLSSKNNCGMAKNLLGQGRGLGGAQCGLWPNISSPGKFAHIVGARPRGETKPGRGNTHRFYAPFTKKGQKGPSFMGNKATQGVHFPPKIYNSFLCERQFLLFVTPKGVNSRPQLPLWAHTKFVPSKLV